jgi:CBS domain containing-hemolysin-like protein
MLGLGLAALFIVLNGFFVAAEFALVKLRATRGVKKAPGSWREGIVLEAVDKLDRYLGVTQLGITLVSLGLGWIGEPAVADLGERVFSSVTGRELGSAGRGVIFAAAFAILTMIHVLFGELVPKLIAIQRSRESAIVTVPLLRAVHILLYPGLFLLEVTSRAVLKLIGLPFDAYGEAALSEDEILGILAANLTRQPGAEQKQELLRRVMRFSARTAKMVMIPRMDVASLPVDSTGAEAIEFARQQQYSRILLTRGDSLDDVAGYLYVKDLLFNADAATLKSMEPLRRDAMFVPESQGLVDVLRTMQKTHTPFAVVVDEYGGTSGIVTMEDLLEEIVGEIQDELDQEAGRIEKKGNAWEVDARVTLAELGSVGVDVEEGERNESVGAAVVARLRRLPRIGDKVEVGGMTAEVLHVARRRVTRVRVTGNGAASSTA